jgi:dTMP kinase
MEQAQSKTLSKGLLIAFEGIDGAGKSTLIQSLNAAFVEQGFNTLLTKEPGDTELGKEVRALLQTQTTPITPKAQFLLFAADRAEHFSKLIIPALEAKKLVLSDRLADSSVAYQGYGDALPLGTIQNINAWAMNSTIPDLTVFVRIPVEIAIERCNKRGALSAYEKKEFLYKVAAGFEELYKNRMDVIIANGMESPEDLSKQVYDAIEEWININKLAS